MTKQQEIDALVKFTNSIPQDSCLWPWLVQVQGQVVADIRNDFMVSPDIAQTRKDCETMLAEARQQAEQILADAQQKAEREMAQTRQWRNSQRDSLLQVIEHARQAVLGY
jgi:cell division septum initiation protein DivIVA